MKKIIRKGVFETNSSSSHSVSISGEDKQFVMDTLYPNQFGVIQIEGDEYGWGWFKSNDATFKASYAAQQFENDELALEMLKEVIMEQTGATDVEFVRLGDGYIDHDSVGILTKTKEWLRDFIFNKNSWVFGGNDNDTPDPTFYHVPEFKDGKMIQPVYKYELCIDGVKKKTKFLNYPSDKEIEDAIYSLINSNVYVTENGHVFEEESIYFQLNKPKNLYEFSWRYNQDFSKKEILFIKEDAYRLFDEIKEKLEKTKNWDKKSFHQKDEMILKEALKIDGLFKKIPFFIFEIQDEKVSKR